MQGCYTVGRTLQQKPSSLVIPNPFTPMAPLTYWLQAVAFSISPTYFSSSQPEFPIPHITPKFPQIFQLHRLPSHPRNKPLSFPNMLTSLSQLPLQILALNRSLGPISQSIPALSMRSVGLTHRSPLCAMTPSHVSSEKGFG